MAIEETFWSIKIADVINAAILIATIVAIVYGPLRAVQITRKKDLERDADARKRAILAALMRTRKMTMHPDHVGALNQVQLEFFNFAQVVDTYRAYIANLSETIPQPGNDLNNFLTRRNDRFFDLLHQIAIASGVTIDRHELDRLAYVPFGWQTEQEEIRIFRTSLIEVLQGRKALAITPVPPEQQPAPAINNPYPPAPA
jgi:hypothetical protein